MPYAYNGHVRIAYEVFGQDGGIPVVLVSGTGVQMLAWPEAFCEALVAEGFQVVRLDNRDSGLSTHFVGARVPGRLHALLQPASAPYHLCDMAGDVIAVLDARNWHAAHVVGSSLGGMIAQEVVLRYPGRILSLTSVMSTPSARIATIPRRTVLQTLRSARREPASGPGAAGERAVTLKRAMAGRGYAVDEELVRNIGRRSFERCPESPEDGERQRIAVTASGDRRRQLGTVRVPTLVLHGEDDPVIDVRGGRATAAAVPGAQLVTYPGLGHDLPPALWPTVVDEIAGLLKASGNSSAVS